jgi:hypothetical protein
LGHSDNQASKSPDNSSVTISPKADKKNDEGLYHNHLIGLQEICACKGLLNTKLISAEEVALLLSKEGSAFILPHARNSPIVHGKEQGFQASVDLAQAVFGLKDGGFHGWRVYNFHEGINIFFIETPVYWNMFGRRMKGQHVDILRAEAEDKSLVICGGFGVVGFRGRVIGVFFFTIV